MGTLLGEIPVAKTVVFWVIGLAQWSAEVNALTGWENKKMLEILELFTSC